MTIKAKAGYHPQMTKTIIYNYFQFLVAAGYGHGDSAIDRGLVEERNILIFFGFDEKLMQEAVRREQIELAKS